MKSIRKSRYTLAFPVKGKMLLVNGLSGAVRLVEKETAQKVFNNEVTDKLEPFFTHLTPEEEYKKAQALCNFLMERAKKCADGCIAVTYDCNLRCPYCYEVWVKHPETMKMVVDTYKVDKAFEALEYLNEACTKEKSLTLTGGEPLMKKNEDIIKYILKTGTDKGYEFIIFTNGVELDYFLSDLSSIPLDYVQITLDGPPSLHNKRRVFKRGKGTFDTIVSNIEKARELELPLAIRTNTDSEILDKIDELAIFFRKREWTDDPNIHFSLAALYDQHVDPEKTIEYVNLYQKALELVKNEELHFIGINNFVRHFRRLYPLCRDLPRFWPSFWYCNAVVNRYVFDPFGDVYPCRSMLGWKEERIGVYVPELQFNENCKKWRERTIFAMEECTECDLALVCGGDCGYASLLNEKDLFTPMCTTTEQLVQDYIEHIIERRNTHGSAQGKSPGFNQRRT